jgi:hypothetical protein
MSVLATKSGHYFPCEVIEEVQIFQTENEMRAKIIKNDGSAHVIPWSYDDTINAEKLNVTVSNFPGSGI